MIPKVSKLSRNVDMGTVPPMEITTVNVILRRATTGTTVPVIVPRGGVVPRPPALAVKENLNVRGR